MAEEKSVVTDYCEKELGKRLRNIVQTREWRHPTLRRYSFVIFWE